MYTAVFQNVKTVGVIISIWFTVVRQYRLNFLRGGLRMFFRGEYEIEVKGK